MRAAALQRERGRYFTTGNPFHHPAFAAWAHAANLPGATILEPFAGANGLIVRLSGMGWCRRFRAYDIDPAHADVRTRDTLAAFPRQFDVCVTNPPWLARNSATARGLPFPDSRHDDVYQHALALCLEHCAWVAALVPESFIRANLFHDRLREFVSLTLDLFDDTRHPVGLALFGPTRHADVVVWSGMERVGLLSAVKTFRPQPTTDGAAVRFNDPDGNVGLIALDNTREASIRFCPVRELRRYHVKHTGRHITKLSVDGGDKNIKEWNDALTTFRSATRDVLMTCYKGIRQDGKYRRRCDWSLARGIIHHVG